MTIIRVKTSPEYSWKVHQAVVASTTAWAPKDKIGKTFVQLSLLGQKKGMHCSTRLSKAQAIELAHALMSVAGELNE